MKRLQFVWQVMLSPGRVSHAWIWGFRFPTIKSRSVNKVPLFVYFFRRQRESREVLVIEWRSQDHHSKFNYWSFLHERSDVLVNYSSQAVKVVETSLIIVMLSAKETLYQLQEGRKCPVTQQHSSVVIRGMNKWMKDHEDQNPGQVNAFKWFKESEKCNEKTVMWTDVAPKSSLPHQGHLR